MVSLGQKLKMPKRCEKRLYDHFIVVVCTKLLQKTPNTRKMKAFKKKDQNWPPCMGYSPCKLVSLGQKLKMLRRCEERLYDHIRVVVCKKLLQKTPNIRKIRGYGQNWPKCIDYSPCKMVSLGQKLKMPKSWVENWSSQEHTKNGSRTTFKVMQCSINYFT